MLKVNGKWKEVSWDEALGFITDKLQTIKKKYGAKAFLAYLGDPFIGVNRQGNGEELLSSPELKEAYLGI